MNKNIKTKHTFQSEIKQLLNIMINSLYSNKEIFIRELISNASDAIEKLKFKSIQKPKKYIEPKNMHIRIKINQEKNTITISDNGIGMNYKETIKNLGTIAKSGTKEFLSSIKNNQQENNQLIGKFGVGFYSSFIVSNLVKVKTKKATKKPNEATLWESKGTGNYHISKIKKKNTGTKITLTLKIEEKEFLNSWKIKNIINKYSDHITVPIEIYTYDEKNKTYFWEKINKAQQALWTKNKNEISKLEYQEFYKYINNDTHNPLIWIHNKIEGNPEYINLLYIPKKNNKTFWNKNNKNGIKLYINRIYIMDDNKQFLPNYLRFIKGILDSQDLPLNISREILQNNNITKKIQLNLTKKILNTLLKLAELKPKKYNKFWKEFGLIIKEGPAEDFNNKEIILNLLRFTSINNNTKKQTISLNNYIKNMQKNQKKIFYITSENYISGKNNPHLEIFKEKNIDVLILSDRIDEWMMSYITEYNGKKFQSVNKLDNSITKLDKIDKKYTEKNPNIKNFIEKIKKILGDRVKDVKITNRLKETPTAVICDAKDMSTQMSKLFIAAGQKVNKLKYIFEINIKHNIIKHIQNISNNKEFKNWIELLLDQALLVETGNLENPNKFITNINKLLFNYKINK